MWMRRRIIKTNCMETKINEVVLKKSKQRRRTNNSEMGSKTFWTHIMTQYNPHKSSKTKLLVRQETDNLKGT